MRHLGSLLAGLLAAPVVWLLTAIGQPLTTDLTAKWVARNGFNTVDLIGPLAYLAVAGLLLGMIASLRLSPLGPAAAGLAYLAVYGGLFANPLRVIDAIPNRIDLGFVDARPRVPVTNGTLAILAVCLLVAVASGARWRRWPTTGALPAAEEGTATDPTAPTSEAPTAPAPTAEPSATATTAPADPTAPPLSLSRPSPRPPLPRRAARSRARQAAETTETTEATPSSTPPPWPPPAEKVPTPVPTETRSADHATATAGTPAAPGPGESGTPGEPQGASESTSSPWSAPPRSPRG